MHRQFLKYSISFLIVIFSFLSNDNFIFAQQNQHTNIVDNVVIHVVDNTPTELTARIKTTVPGEDISFLFTPIGSSNSGVILETVPWTIGNISLSLNNYAFDPSTPGQLQYLYYNDGGPVELLDRLTINGGTFEADYTITSVVSMGEDGPSNSVRVNWSTVELEQNSNGQYTYSFHSLGNVTRENTTTVHLNVSKTSQSNPQDISYYTLCTFGTVGGLSFNVAYPTCANPQNILNAQSGYIYKIYFSDAVGSSQIINNLSGGQGIFQLPLVPGNSSESENPSEDPGGTSDNGGDEGTFTPTDPTGGNIIIAGDDGGGLVSKECGYNLGAGEGGRVCGFSDLIGLLDRIIQYIFVLSIPIAALVFAYAGYLYLTSGGNPSKHTMAVKAMTTVVKGILVVMLAWLIVKTILVSLGVNPNASWFWLDI